MWQNNKGVVIALIVGLVIGYAVGASWGGRSDKTAKSASQASGETVGGASANVPSDNISVADQPAGAVVNVTRVITDVATWVAVREDNAGMPGDILGAALLPVPGENSDLDVELLVPTTAGNKYHLNLYADNGDRLFDNHTDRLLADDAVFTAN